MVLCFLFCIIWIICTGVRGDRRCDAVIASSAEPTVSTDVYEQTTLNFDPVKSSTQREPPPNYADSADYPSLPEKKLDYRDTSPPPYAVYLP